eukprot:XP_015576323.1 uncharacterized protein LOC8268737 [Ricinus communis]
MANRCHVRSISLPSRSHPATIRIEEELSKLKPLEASSASTLSSLCFDLSGVDGLYHCVNDLLHLASTQQVLSRHQSQKCLNQLIDWSVRLIDACSITRDAMLQFKEQVQALQSALRRRKGDLSIQENIDDYSCFRKKMRKEANKLIAELKQMDNKLGALQLPDQDQHLSALIRVLREVNVKNSSVFQSFLLFLATPVSKPTQSRWSMVSKLMHKRTPACEETQEIVNELQSVDYALNEMSNVDNIQIARKKLQDLEISIEELENCLERVFRHLIKTRASILNIFSQ